MRAQRRHVTLEKFSYGINAAVQTIDIRKLSGLSVCMN